MKKTLRKKLEGPRYITIRIQYYPINKWFLLIPIFVFLFFVMTWSFKYITSYPFAYTSLRGVSLNETTKQSSNMTKFDMRLPHALHAFAMTEDLKKIDKPQVVFHGPRDKKEIALTFDADMTPGMLALLDSGEVSSYYNKAVIDVLNQTQTKATLFLTGMWIERYPEATKEFANDPLFELASHSYSHPGFDGACYGLTPLSDNQTIEEITKTQDLLFSFTGIPNTLFRFPGGCYSQQDVATVSSQGVRVIQWDAPGQDGFNEDPLAIENNVLSNVQNGSIIVLHMHGGPNAPKTAEALPFIISSLKEQGFTFVTVSELLGQEKTFQAVDLRKHFLTFR